MAPVTLASWRAKVEKELAGKPFDKTLVHASLEGIPIQPLYTEAPALPRVFGDGAPFRICMRHEADATREAIVQDLEDGADALWLPSSARGAVPAKLPKQTLLLLDEDANTTLVGEEQAALISTLEDHLQGADAAEEIAIALSGAAAEVDRDAAFLLVRVTVGRDTFIELCKLRALRIGLRKVLGAMGSAARFWIHAVASPRTLAVRDPWVNMLRVTTEAFSAILGGADLVTPLPFDDVLSVHSALGRRVARNTGHVLREESGLGRVVDPAGGSYYFDSLTDALAREAWSRFQAIEKQGGIAQARANGYVESRVGRERAARQEQIAKRKLAVLGVSEFANLKERLPSPPGDAPQSALRDAAPFEALRARAEALPADEAEVLLSTLGPAAESRARVGFAVAFFAAAGLRARELREGESAPRNAKVCVCGSDERYASEGSERVRSLRASQARQVLLAGRPGALEEELREAGVDDFVYLGCDALAVLAPLVEAP